MINRNIYSKYSNASNSRLVRYEKEALIKWTDRNIYPLLLFQSKYNIELLFLQQDVLIQVHDLWNSTQ
jgi:hypothetical protein